jgi:hypothetical protein
MSMYNEYNDQKYTVSGQIAECVPVLHTCGAPCIM